MPWTKGALELFKFQRDHIVGQYEGRLSQRKVSKNLSLKLATVNRVIDKCSREGKKFTDFCSAHPGSSQSELCFLLREMLRIILIARPLA